MVIETGATVARSKVIRDKELEQRKWSVILRVEFGEIWKDRKTKVIANMTATIQ